MVLDKILAIVLFFCLLVFIAWLDGTWAEVFQIITSKLQGCVEQNGAVWGIKNAAVSVTFGKFPPPKIALGCSMNYYIVVSCIYISLWYIQLMIQEKLYPCKKKKKNQTTLYCISKTRHSCATSASCVLGTRGLSPEWVLQRFPQWSKVLTRGRERERGSPCCGALLPPPPSSTAPPPRPPSIANVAHSSLAPRPPRQVEQSRRHPFSETKIKKLHRDRLKPARMIGCSK